MARQDFDEWQGMIAAVALNHIYSGAGLKLSIQPVHLEHVEADKTKHNIVHRCILMEMDKDTAYKSAITRRDINGNPEEGYLFYICQNGAPFAIFHPEVGLAAMKQYDASIFAGILPWHKADEADCHKAWLPVVDPLNPHEQTMLDDFCLSRVAWWAAQNDMLNYQAFIRARLTDSNHVPAAQPGEAIANAVDIDSIWPGKGTSFGTSLMFYTDPNGVNYALPELFLSNMLLTAVDGQANNKLIYNVGNGITKPICFKGNPAALERYAPVAPFRQAFSALLQHCALEDMVFDANVIGNSLSEVKVAVTIRTNAGEKFTIRKTYGSDNLLRGKVPYMMIWPYIPLPKHLNLWKSFYATWEDQSGGMSRILDRNGGDIADVYKLTFDFEGQGVTNTVSRATAPADKAWKVCSGETPFRYAVLKGKRSERDPGLREMGMIFIPEYDRYDAYDTDGVNFVASPVKLAVDFGTTSTVCALRQLNHKENAKIPLPFRDYSLTVTCEEESAKKTVDEQHWLGNLADAPNGEWAKKIFSVAQLFDSDDVNKPSRASLAEADKQKLYRDARLFLVSGGALSNYVTGTENGQASRDPLKQQWIMNDMKFAKELDILNHHAASAYLAGIYMYAILYLLAEKVLPAAGNYIDLSISYPNEVTLNALRMNWKYATNILNRMMDSRLTQAISSKHYVDEATATSRYYRSSELDAARSRAICDGLVSLDIGGGTTDISITHKNHPKKIATLSLRYAGREVMVTSLIQFFRRFHSGAQISHDTFTKIWEKDDVTLRNQFLAQCGTEEKAAPSRPNLQAMTTNNSVRMCVEMLLSEGMKLENVDTDSDTPLLRQLIALKFFMMMRVVARSVRENIDLWRLPANNGQDPASMELEMINKKLTVWLSVSGTSAQMLQYIFDCDMDGLSELRDDPYDSRKRACMDLLNLMFTEELRDVLKADESAKVRIMIDRDVKEKVEVCYGMLVEDEGTPIAVGAPRNVIDLDNIGNEEEEKRKRREKEEARQDQLRRYPISNLQAYLQDKLAEDGTVEAHGLLHFIQKYERIYFSNNYAMNYGLGDRIYRISALLNNFANEDAFQESRTQVSRKYARYMVEDEQQNYIDLLTSMYLVEEIIDWEMANCQRG